MPEQAIHIALTFDDGFWAPAFATMRSVALTTRRRADLVFHLLHWRLAAGHRRELDAVAEEFGVAIRHYPLADNPEISARIARLPGTREFPAIVYARLLLDDLLPSEIERFVYLDSDLYVRAPIERLAELDLGGKSLAAASEPGRHHLVAGDDMRTRQGPFDIADPYFNSGVLVVDRAAWKRVDLPAFLHRLDEHGELSQLYHDQDILNLAFAGDWLELEPRWNLTKPHPALRSLDPYIVHYTTGMKPWKSLAYVAFGSSYRHVMTRAVFRRYRRERWRKRLGRLIGR